MKEIKIDKGIPPPNLAISSSFYSKMEYGDSILCDSQKEANRVHNAIRSFLRNTRKEGKVVQKKQDDGKTRIWLLEEDTK